MTRRRPLVLPVIDLHLVREFAGAFLLTLAAFVTIYVLAEFFDRVDRFLEHGASLGAMLRYFLFRLPFVLSQVTPFAVLVGTLVGLGLLARQNEFVALRACGVSIWQIVTPLLVTGVTISVATMIWNETVVPASARRARAIETREIKGRRGAATVFTGRDVWFHGRAGFYNIDKVSLRRQALYGLAIFQVGEDFRPVRLIEIDLAAWNGAGWKFDGKRTRIFGTDGTHDVPGLPRGFVLPERFSEFGAVKIEPEELSYGMLRREIKDFRRKGVDASESLVDLHLKLAFPVASLVMMLLAVPLAASGTRLTSFAASVGLGFVVGFAYFVVLAFARPLGQLGALPPALAAWAANGLFALIGLYFLLGADS